MTEPTDRLKIREIGTTEWVKKWTNVNGEWIDTESLSTRLTRDTHISFARFYNEHSGSEPPLSDVEIYAMWQEKSREK